MNIEGNFECGAFPKYRRKKPDFALTGGLRNHRRKIHEKPREGGGQPRKGGEKPSNVTG
jgi:hypothetical protein